jgi:hypothetical protein
MFSDDLGTGHHTYHPMLKLIDFNAATDQEYEPKQRLTDTG